MAFITLITRAGTGALWKNDDSLILEHPEEREFDILAINSIKPENQETRFSFCFWDNITAPEYRFVLHPLQPLHNGDDSTIRSMIDQRVPMKTLKGLCLLFSCLFDCL